MRSTFEIARRRLWSRHADQNADARRPRLFDARELRHSARPRPGRLHQSGARCRFPRSGGRPRARHILLRLCDAKRARRQMVNIQLPVRPIWSLQHLGDALPAKPSWLRRRRISGRRMSLATATLLHVLFGQPDVALKDDKRGLCLALQPPADRLGRSSTWQAAAMRRRLRQHRPDELRRSEDRQAPALLGLRLSPDQGSGAGRRPPVIRRGKQSVDLIPVMKNDPANIAS